MTSRPARIAIAACAEVGVMVAGAIVLVAVCEGLNWFACWRQAREEQC
jgi:hypothetical protein